MGKRSELIVAKMAAEVSSRDCDSIGEEKRGFGRPNRSPKKLRTAGRIKSLGQVHNLLKDEEVHGMTASVFQGKVKALKEKQMREKKEESKTVEYPGGEGNTDASVTPQLRTYLTEELLDYSKHGGLSDTQQDGWRSDELWETYSSEGSSVPCCSGCKNLSNHNQDTDSSSVKSQDRMSSSSDNLIDVSSSTSKRRPMSLTLAERVERNRQELRSKFGRTACHGENVIHAGELDQRPSDKSGSWGVTQSADGDPEVPLPGTEDCGELSIRHEQAKQLLQRARMKAKGAAPLRASHCVLPNPHLQQPTQHRCPSYSGVLTDGGSLSDSSSSDHCSCHKGSRGSSPSHVRFQDESEREAEERYRERQQVPQTSPVIATPPRKRQSNGIVSWTEPLSPAGHGECGTGSPYLKGQATTHGTNLRNAHLGSKITQDGSVSSPLAAKFSPHWILPSQPWRVHTELIRETHIGGDSTPDSSGEDDCHRTHNKKSRDPRIHKSCKQSPEQESTLHPSHTCLQDMGKEGSSPSNQHSESKNGLSGHTLENRVKRNSNLSEPIFKTNSGAVGRNCVDSVRTGPRKLPETNPTEKHKKTAPEFGAELNSSNQEIGIGSIVLNMDTTEGRYQMDSTTGRTHVTFVRPPVVSSHGLSGHVPVPPSGKAPTSRSRHTLRSGVTHQLNISHEGGMAQSYSVQSNLVPKTSYSAAETVGSPNSCELSPQGMRTKEHKSRERPQKLRRHLEDRKAKDSKENRDSAKHQLSKEPRENGGPYTSSSHTDCDKHSSSTDQRGQGYGSSGLSRDQEKSGTYPKRSGTNEQQTCSHNADMGSGKSSLVNSFTCQTTSAVQSSMDRSSALVDEGSPQPGMKKRDLCSGMRKIFSSIGLAPRPKMERFHSTSLEQISSTDRHGRSPLTDGDCESFNNGSPQPGRIKKSPSLQSLKLMSPFHLPRKASSVQNLTAKCERSAVYSAGELSTAPRRALSVEDIGSPGQARALGKVAEVFADGTRLLQLQRPDNGTFGFRISSVSGRPDSGIYVQEMSNANTAKLYSGLLRVGDEILEVNGTKVSMLGQPHLTALLNREPVLQLRVLHQRRTQC